MQHQTIVQNNKNGKRPNYGQPNSSSRNELPAFVKLPPQALELEAAIIGAVALEGVKAYEKVSDLLKANCFYSVRHQAIWESFENLIANGTPIDLLTIVEFLRAAGKLEIVGGPYELTKITNTVVSSAHIEAHAKIVYQYYLRREYIDVCGNAINAAYDDSVDILETQEKIEADLLRLTSWLQVSAYHDANALAFENLAKVEGMQSRAIGLTGVPTGYKSLNRLTNGWQPTDLIILAARPAVGKTAFGLNLVRNAAADPIKPTGVGFFSLEMSASQLTYRFASLISGVDLDRIMRARMTETELKRYRKAMEVFSQLNIKIDETGGITLSQLRRKARQMVFKEKVGLIIVDYLQLMSGDRDKSGNREQEISGISRGLKALAKELNVPIIALSQLSRAIETRQNKEPMLSDLRESGSIEADADAVIFVSRADYGISQAEADPSLKGSALIKFAKHRNGDLETLAFQTELRIMQWNEHNPYAQANDPSSYQNRGNEYESF